MVQFREPVEVAQLFLYHTKIWGEAFADRCELFVQDPGGAYRSLRQFRHRQPWSSIEFPATKAQRFKLVFQTFDNFAKYVVQQKLKIRELQLLPKDRKPTFLLISDWDNQAGYIRHDSHGGEPPGGPDREYLDQPDDRRSGPPGGGTPYLGEFIPAAAIVLAVDEIRTAGSRANRCFPRAGK